jgi:nitrate reductase NapE component
MMILLRADLHMLVRQEVLSFNFYTADIFPLLGVQLILFVHHIAELYNLFPHASSGNNGRRV